MSDWSPEEDEMLKALWERGLSYSQIVVELAREGFDPRTRNAAGGRGHRLGLVREIPSARPRPTPQAAEPRPKPKSPSPPLPPRLPPAAPVVAETRPVERTIDRPGISTEELDAAFRLCRYPLWPDHGRTKAADLTFCGAQVVDGRSYCACHCRIAFQPLPQRQRAA